MEGNTGFIEPLVEKAEAYGKTSLELLKLTALDKTAGIASAFISRGTAILFFSMFVLVANIGIALWLGDLLGKSYFGFFVIAGFYGIGGSIVYFFMHERIKESISNSIISQALNS